MKLKRSKEIFEGYPPLNECSRKLKTPDGADAQSTGEPLM